MAQIKISELPTLAQQLQSANYIPLIHNGVTYKYAPFNYVVKNTGNETIAGVKTFSSSPIIPDATTATQAVSKGQLDTVNLKTTPVDNSSRVAEYTGDGIPLIPDNVAGRTYYKNKDFTDTTGWTAGAGTTMTVEGSMLKAVTPAGTQTILYLSNSSYQNKSVNIIIRSSIPLTNITTIIGSSVFSAMKIQNLGGNRYLATIYWSRTGSDNLTIMPEYGTMPVITWYVETIYIGNGAYDTPALDRAGNGNNLTLKAVTPVNGKYGKEMSFNGSTSYAQASSPVIGTTGTVAVRFKAKSFVSAGRLFDNANGVTGISLRQSSNTNIQLLVYDSVSAMETANISIVQTEYNTVVVSYNGLAFSIYVNGIKQGDYTSARQFVAGLNNLIIGRYALSSVEFFNGIISHFRYDSRIWTADEARAWSLNPISIDSRV